MSDAVTSSILVSAGNIVTLSGVILRVAVAFDAVDLKQFFSNGSQCTLSCVQRKMFVVGL